MYRTGKITKMDRLVGNRVVQRVGGIILNFTRRLVVYRIPYVTLCRAIDTKFGVVGLKLIS